MKAFTSQASTAVLSLQADGTISDCSGFCDRLFGYSREELVSRPIASLLPQLGKIDLLEDGANNSRLSFLSHIGIPFPAVDRHGRHFPCDVVLSAPRNASVPAVQMILRRHDESPEAAFDDDID